MILKPVFNVLKRVIKYNNISIIRNSALFVNGAKATENYLFVTPHIDFSENLQNKEIILEQLRKRNTHFNFDKLEDLWSVYEDLRSTKIKLENKKSQISKELSKIIKNDQDIDIHNKLQLQISLLKENIKKLKEPLWSAEEAAILEALKLPNKLHPYADTTHQVQSIHLAPPKNNKNHKKISDELNLVEFKNNSYYLKGDAAIFELGAKFYFSNFLKENNFIQFSNPDFVKSVIVEGCGKDHTDPETSFILNHNEDTKVNPDNRLHLIGGGSLCSFFAYHAKNVLYPKIFPIKYFTMGCQYVPTLSKELNLLNVSQSSVIQIFNATKSEEHLDTSLHELINITKDLYSKFGYHYRICLIPADKLERWESLRVTIEMYSTSLDKYVEVANISVSGDYISKRLMFTYVESKQSKFPYIISGTILNVPKFLACALEQDQNFTCPDVFKVENWSI